MKLILLLSFVAVGAMAYPEKRNTQCNSMCPMYVIQFCGSDGKTYTSNECFIKSQMCREGRNDFDAFTTLHMGACTGVEVIGEPKTTVAVTNEKRAAHCNSFCPMYIIEFCGSDGVTYNSNPCFIQSRMCAEGKNDFATFTTLHMGACTGDELIGESKTTTVAPAETTVVP